MRTRARLLATPAVASATLLLAACGPAPQRAADGVPETAVAVTDTTCVPNRVTVTAGRNRFVITNRSMRPLEWEILDGVMVVDERENIVPGLSQTLTTTLKPGSYVMTCGLLTNPRGALVVTANPNAEKQGPAPLDFISAQAEYKVFVRERLATMQQQVGAFAYALRAGDVERARKLYAPSREAWQQLAPAAVLASAQYDRLEGSAALYRGGASDPAFVGWHRIEAMLFGTAAQADNTTLKQLADGLQADTQSLSNSLASASSGIDGIFRGASLAARRISERKLEGLDNPLAHTDLDDARNNLVGLRKVASIFDGALTQHAPLQRAALQRDLPQLQSQLDALVTMGGDAAARKAAAATALKVSADFDAALAQLQS